MNLIYPRLPEGYAELEYLESTGTQYIDTGMKGTQNTSIEMKIAFTQAVTGSFFLVFGSRQSASVASFGCALSSSEPNAVVDFGDYTETRLEASYELNVPTIITNSKTSRSFGDYRATTAYTGADFETPGNIYLLWGSYANMGTIPTYKVSGKLYSCKLWNGTTLVRHMIPAQCNSDSAVGMYDLVNDVFYTNAGTGAFTAGPKLHYVKGVAYKPGINLWDEVWEAGRFSTDNGTPVSSNVCIRSKNYIPVVPDTTYYAECNPEKGLRLFFYGSGYSYIGTSLANNIEFTTPDNACFMRFHTGSDSKPVTTYDGDIIINLSDPAINGHYYPYAKAIKSIAIGEDVIWSVPAARQETIDEVFVPSVWTDEDLNNMPEESTIETGENQLTIEEVEDNEPAEQS